MLYSSNVGALVQGRSRRFNLHPLFLYLHQDAKRGDRTQPRVGAVCQTEIWPGLARLCHRASSTADLGQSSHLFGTDLDRRQCLHRRFGRPWQKPNSDEIAQISTDRVLLHPAALGHILPRPCRVSVQSFLRIRVVQFRRPCV
jgi:hypothetical protein